MFRKKQEKDSTMKRQTKKILLIAAVALAILVLAAGLIMLLRKDSFGDNYFTRNKAIATVNGAKITKNEFAASLSNYYNNIDTYNMYAMYYGYGKYYDVNSETGVRDLKKDNKELPKGSSLSCTKGSDE